MESRSKLHPAGSVVLALLAALTIAACASPPRFWPWRADPPEPVQPVQELHVTATDGAGSAAGILQFWDRNTLVLDLQSVSGSGVVVLRPGDGRPWPVRLGFRVTPGRIGTLEVRGAQRVVLPIPAEGAAPIDLRLAPGVYRSETQRIDVQWGPAVQ